jgi:hypothetical protein
MYLLRTTEGKLDTKSGIFLDNSIKICIEKFQKKHVWLLEFTNLHLENPLQSKTETQSDHDINNNKRNDDLYSAVTWCTTRSFEMTNQLFVVGIEWRSVNHSSANRAHRCVQHRETTNS